MVANIFKTSSKAFGLVPGLLVIIANVGVPPGMSKLLYGAILESIGAFTILMMWMNRDSLSKVSIKWLNVLSILCMLTFLVSFSLYFYLYQVQVIYSPQYEISVFFPFWLNSETETLITIAGSKLDAITRYGPQSIIDSIEKEYRHYLVISNLCFLLLYVIFIESLVIGFMLLGIKTSSSSN